jgi:hypothetical protein
MKLSKILCFLIALDFICIIILFNLDNDAKYTTILESVSDNGKYRLSLIEEKYLIKKNIEVNFRYKDEKLDQTYSHSMKIEVPNKSKISKSDFTINWYEDFLKIIYTDSYDKTSREYRIYFEDLEYNE